MGFTANLRLNLSGEVVFWSHNGVTGEKWANVADWRAQMTAESEE